MLPWHCPFVAIYLNGNETTQAEEIASKMSKSRIRTKSIVLVANGDVKMPQKLLTDFSAKLFFDTNLIVKGSKGKTVSVCYQSFRI